MTINAGRMYIQYLRRKDWFSGGGPPSAPPLPSAPLAAAAAAAAAGGRKAASGTLPSGFGPSSGKSCVAVVLNSTSSSASRGRPSVGQRAGTLGSTYESATTRSRPRIVSCRCSSKRDASSVHALADASTGGEFGSLSTDGSESV